MAKKKVTKIKEGITTRKTKTGINVTISTNGRVLCTMRGYNNNANVQKGLRALRDALDKNSLFFQDVRMSKFAVTDLTPKPKAKKKK